MSNRIMTIVAALLLIFGSTRISAEERMIVGSQQGSDLVVTGAVDTLTSPSQIVQEIGEDTQEFGPGGLVTGTVKGGIMAIGQAARGGAFMAIGILDVLTSPFADRR